MEDGFSNWDNGPKRIKSHSTSTLHKHAIFATSTSKGKTIAEKIDVGHQKQMIANRVALTKIFSTISLLGQQGIPLRGHQEDSSNFIRLLETRAGDVGELNQWLTSTDKRKWLSHDIQNEILQRLSDKILRQLVSEVQGCDFFSIILDESPDCASLEQLSICVRIVTSTLEIKENFLGFYSINSTTVEALFDVVKDVFTRLQFDMSKLRGQCYDGASNMSGRNNGLHTKISAIEPRALYVHCNAHNINLVVQDAISGVPWTRDNIGMAKEIIKFVRDSPKRLFAFKELMEKGKSLKAFNPTR